MTRTQIVKLIDRLDRLCLEKNLATPEMRYMAKSYCALALVQGVRMEHSSQKQGLGQALVYAAQRALWILGHPGFAVSRQEQRAMRDPVKYNNTWE